MSVYGPYALRVSEEQRKLARVEFDRVSFFLPSTQLEKGWFAAVSVNAGFSEELLYRSFLIVYLEWLNPWVAAAFSALVFGLAHLYQGWKGALGTVIMAAIFTVIVAGTGSLVLAMVLHAIWDFRILFMSLDKIAQEPSVN